MTGLSTPRSIYGVHSVTPYSRVDGSYYGILKVVESSSISLSAKQNDLYGGSNKFQWASETGEINSEMSLKVSQMQDFMFYLFLGKLPSTGADASASISSPLAVKGTLINATTGVASITITTAADVKFAKYVLIATAGKKVKLYVSTDADFSRGTPASYVDDTLLAVAEITLTDTSGTDVVTGHGLTITGGSGTLAFNVGDSVVFYTRPINLKESTVNIGSASDIFPEFGAVIMAQKRGTDELFEIDAYRCKAAGMPIAMDMFAWAKTDIKVKLLYDIAKDGVFQMRYVSNAS